MQVWRLIYDIKPKDGFHNMAIDEVLLRSCENGKAPPTIRIYRWSSNTLTIGYAQRVRKILDIKFCRNNNIDIVSRITGGKAVLHNNELTYSIICKRKGLFPDSIAESYSMIQKGLISALSSLKIPSERVRIPLKRRGEACFAASSLHEITLYGKKIAGGAQRRFKRSFLQQGSILLKANPGLLSRCFKYASNDEFEKYSLLLKNSMAGINDINASHISFESLAKAVIYGFQQKFAIQLANGDMSHYEKKSAKELYKSKRSILIHHN